MQLTRYQSPQVCYDRAEAFLCANEAANNLIIGLMSQLRSTDNPYSEPPYLAIVEHEGKIISVGLRTPPHNFIISHMDAQYGDDVLDLFVADLSTTYDSIPGVIGATHLSKQFGERWTSQHDLRLNLKMKERAYQLETVTPVRGVSGYMRKAEARDRDLLIRWYDAFAVEALDESLDDIPERVDGFLNASADQRRFYLWEDAGQAVSMAGYTRPTPNGYSVSYVYTPPDQRKRGYASAIVAGVSQHVLDMGRKYTFLFTDLANPTSNHIYQEIGYRPVVDVDVYSFE